MKKYSDLIGLNGTQSDDKHSKHDLLKHCWEIRNFEIELFWKRATYFSILVGAIFIAFYTLLSKGDNVIFTIILAGLGCITSFAWYLVNKGSKFWQENWEHHIDLLENEIGISLYRTVLGDKKEAYSVSRICIFLSYVLFGAWCITFGFMIGSYISSMVVWYKGYYVFAFINPFIIIALLCLICITCYSTYYICTNCKTKFNSDRYDDGSIQHSRNDIKYCQRKL